MAADDLETNVFICGGGPVGLLIAYMLARMGVKTCIIERHDKVKNEGEYGRAAAMFPRSLELFGQIDLLDEIFQTAFISRGAVSYKDGKRVPGKGMSVFYKQMAMHQTFLDYEVFIRQKYTESIVLKAYEKCGGHLMVGWALQDMSIDEHAVDGLKVTATIKETSSGVSRIVKSHKVVGADGAHSTVRQLAGIAFKGDSPEAPLKWIRIDCVIKTNMPDSRKGSTMLDSATHGTVLYVCMDHGRTRIGYTVTAEKLAGYGGHLTDEIVQHEAQLAMAPFTLEFVTVDWWTLYDIKQKLASDFTSHDHTIFLAGDACHTHSSGAGQGLNTGFQDAVNLSWKLGGVLNAYYSPSILSTYTLERRPVAQTLIKIDKTISALSSGQIPSDLINPSIPKPDPHALLTATFSDSAAHLVGLGISYSPNVLNTPPSTGEILPGHRCPDAALHPPGSPFPVRLLSHSITPNHGSFWVLVFVGYPFHTRSNICDLRTYLDGPTSFTRTAHPNAVKFLTIIAGIAGNGSEALGVDPFGKFYYDYDLSAHVRYGLSEEAGGIVVMRPDGYLGFATTVDKGEELGEYFEGILMKEE